MALDSDERDSNNSRSVGSDIEEANDPSSSESLPSFRHLYHPCAVARAPFDTETCTCDGEESCVSRIVTRHSEVARAAYLRGKADWKAKLLYLLAVLSPVHILCGVQMCNSNSNASSSSLDTDKLRFLPQFLFFRSHH